MRNLLILGALLALAACGTSKTAATAAVSPFVGTWGYTVSDTPLGSMSGDLVISQENGAYTGYMTGSGQQYKFENLSVEGNKLTGSFYLAAYSTDVPIELTVDTDGKVLTGVALEYPMRAEKK